MEHYLYRCFGYEARPTQMLPLLKSRAKRHSLTEFFPVAAEHSGGLNPIPFNGSGDVTATIPAHGLAMQPAASLQFDKNELITFNPSFNSPL
ncbi:hypothetical protein D3C86_1956900 [compost metagenome]